MAYVLTSFSGVSVARHQKTMLVGATSSSLQSSCEQFWRPVKYATLPTWLDNEFNNLSGSPVDGGTGSVNGAKASDVLKSQAFVLEHIATGKYIATKVTNSLASTPPANGGTQSGPVIFEVGLVSSQAEATPMVQMGTFLSVMQPIGACVDAANCIPADQSLTNAPVVFCRVKNNHVLTGVLTVAQSMVLRVVPYAGPGCIPTATSTSSCTIPAHEQDSYSWYDCADGMYAFSSFTVEYPPGSSTVVKTSALTPSGTSTIVLLTEATHIACTMTTGNNNATTSSDATASSNTADQKYMKYIEIGGGILAVLLLALLVTVIVVETRASRRHHAVASHGPPAPSTRSSTQTSSS